MTTQTGGARKSRKRRSRGSKRAAKRVSRTGDGRHKHHPFYGNQYTTSAGRHRTAARASKKHEEDEWM